MHKTFKYLLYPNRSQAHLLEGQLAEACRLYNGALQERRDAWRMRRVSLNYYTQANQLKEIRSAGNLGLANYSACQDILRRVDKSCQGFFRRVKAGANPGFPRFKSARRFDSFTFPAYGDGCRLRDSGRLYIQEIGELKVKLHRPIKGKVKTLSLKREADRWYACFSVECDRIPLPPSTEAVGIDLGLTAFAVQHDGTQIPNLRPHRTAQATLRTSQRRVARRKRGGNGRRKAVRHLQKAHVHVRNQRANFQHQVSRSLVDRFGLICVENLNVKGLARGMLAKGVHDAGWTSFLDKLAYKAEEAGRLFVKVDPRGTSQRCPCGHSVPKALEDRWHHCHGCGLSVSRDQASAMEILRLGLSLVDGTWPNGASVSTEAVCFS